MFHRAIDTYLRETIKDNSFHVVQDKCFHAGKFDDVSACDEGRSKILFLDEEMFNIL